jgi:hypothetical protein
VLGAVGGAVELSAGLGPSAEQSLSGRIEQSFRRRYEQLPAPARRLLLLAAAEPLGDPALLWRAATAAGLPDESITAADTGNLMSIGLHVQFQHPLARSAVYGAASGHERQAAHRALAEATDPETDPDHRAWHRSQAATGADEKVAAELERSSSRALARGGLAAAAAILERAAQLSPSRPEIDRRGIAAARATYDAGAPDRALELPVIVEAGPPESLGSSERSTITRLRGQIAVSLGQKTRAAHLLLAAAEALAPLEPAAARVTYLEALNAATFAGHFGPPGGVVAMAAEVIRVVPAPPGEPGLVDHLLDGMLTWALDGLPSAVPAFRRALVDLSTPAPDPVAAARWVGLGSYIAASTWDDDLWVAIGERQVASARETGAVSMFPSALLTKAAIACFTGQFAAADALLDEAVNLSTAIGQWPQPGSRAAITAWRGQRAVTESVLEQVTRDCNSLGEDGSPFVNYCTAILNNGLGDYAAAVAAAREGGYAQARCWPRMIRPSPSTGRRSCTSTPVSWCPSATAPVSRSVNGCAGSGAASRHASSSRRPTKHSPRWAQRGSPSMRDANSSPPAGPFSAARRRHATR